MSKKINSNCAKCRRAGVKLILKGEKCLGPKCPFAKRSYAPGQHGPDARRAKLSGYGTQLKEKQKAKRIYGLIERQFSNYVTKSSAKTGDTSKILLAALESRLDNVVYRMGLGKSRLGARQIVSHGLVTVNGKKLDIPSYSVRVGEVVGLSTKGKAKKGFENIAERLSKIDAPSWLSVDSKDVSAKVLNVPQVDDAGFNAKLVIEFYSR
jgi:small subunit ribosomal protein S4